MVVVIGDVEVVYDGALDDAASVLSVDVDDDLIITPQFRRKTHGVDDLAVAFAHDLNRGRPLPTP